VRRLCVELYATMIEEKSRKYRKDVAAYGSKHCVFRSSFTYIVAPERDANMRRAGDTAPPNSPASTSSSAPVRSPAAESIRGGAAAATGSWHHDTSINNNDVEVARSRRGAGPSSLPSIDFKHMPFTHASRQGFRNQVAVFVVSNLTSRKGTSAWPCHRFRVETPFRRSLAPWLLRVSA